MDTAIVPDGCTKFIQAADVVWNACFKRQMRKLYNQWVAAPSGHEFTCGGNMKPPSRSLLCEWVKDSWAEVSVDMVKDSFFSFAITTSLDGTEDEQIHCFKPGQPCAAGRELLAKETKRAQELAEKIDDPFASDEDEEENDENEAIIDDQDNGDLSDDNCTSDED